MAHQHPSPDQLDDYLINRLSEVETANIEQHVFACSVCFPLIKSRELYDLAMTKACVMLGELELDGVRMLTAASLAADGPVSVPQPQVIHPAARRGARFPLWEPSFAAIAATVIAGAFTFSSVDSVRNQSSVPAVALVQARPAANRAAEASMPVVSVATSTLPTAARRRMPTPKAAPALKLARHTRPFLPPNGDVEAPELDMTVPPPVVAPRLQTVSLMARLPNVPKRRVHGSKRVFRALASPFKKLGGALATLANGEDIEDRRSAD